MTSKRSILLEAARLALPLVILLAGVGVFVALGGREELPPRQEEAPPPPRVRTSPVLAAEGGLRIETDGKVMPYREVQLAAEVAGRITFRADALREGYVRKGEPLFRIDRRDYELEVKRLTRELNQAQASLDELDVEEANTKHLLTLAEEERELQAKMVARARDLLLRSAGSADNVDQARRDWLTARNGVQTQKNALEMVSKKRSRLGFARDLVAARLEKAQLDLTRTEIVAPLSGRVVQSEIEKDHYVQPGTLLAVIEDTSAVEVSCHFRMEDLVWLWASRGQQPPQDPKPGEAYRLPPAPVEVIYRLAGREYVWQGEFSRYEGTGVDEKTRTVPVRLLVRNPRTFTEREAPDHSLRPLPVAGPRALVRGMYVIVRARPDAGGALVRFPEEALRLDREGSIVWRVRDGKLSLVPVSVARIVEGQAFTRTHPGLRPDDRVVVSPLAVVEEGMAVREEDRP
jgi:multidrug efflux pump subunit AcrA (membrane-fusion protein)